MSGSAKLYEYLFSKERDIIETPQDLIANKEEFCSKAYHRIVSVNLLGGASPNNSAIQKEVDAKFVELDKNYGYFAGDVKSARASYIKLYDFCLYQNFKEGTNIDEVAERAYKALVIFGKDTPENTIEAIDRFVDKHMADNRMAVHDLFMHNIPVRTPKINLAGWKKHFPNLGYEAIEHFEDAEMIEKRSDMWCQDAHFIKRYFEDRVPTETHFLKELINNLHYKNHDQDPKLAELCMNLNISDSNFAQVLKFRKIAVAKTEDNIPDIHVKIKDGYHLVKLPASDPRALILGMITNCCQSINGDSSQCVEDGVQLADNGFYVFLKTDDKKFDPKNIKWDSLEADGHRIIGQSYVWKSQAGSLTLDSLEVLKDFHTTLDIQNTFKKLGEAITAADPKVSRVTLGAGGGTDNILPANNIKMAYSTSEFMNQGYDYGDAKYQYEIYESPRLTELKHSLADQIKPEIITSITLAELLKKRGDFCSKVNKYVANTDCSVNFDRYLLNVKTEKEIDKRIEDIDFLKQLDSFNAKRLTSKEVVDVCYKMNKSPSDFKDIEKHKIDPLTDIDALKFYTKYDVTFEQLKDLYSCSDLTYKIDKFCLDNSINTKDIKDMNLQNLTSIMGLCAIYKTNYKELKNCDAEKLEALRDSSHTPVWAQAYIKFDDIKTLDVEKIRALTSNEALMFYNDAKIHCSALKDYNLDQINNIIAKKDVFIALSADEKVVEMKKIAASTKHIQGPYTAKIFSQRSSGKENHAPQAH